MTCGFRSKVLVRAEGVGFEPTRSVATPSGFQAGLSPPQIMALTSANRKAFERRRRMRPSSARAVPIHSHCPVKIRHQPRRVLRLSSFDLPNCLHRHPPHSPVGIVGGPLPQPRQRTGIIPPTHSNRLHHHHPPHIPVAISGPLPQKRQRAGTIPPTHSNRLHRHPPYLGVVVEERLRVEQVTNLAIIGEQRRSDQSNRRRERRPRYAAAPYEKPIPVAHTARPADANGLNNRKNMPIY